MKILRYFIVNIFNNNPRLATFVISVMPLFETQGAIPFGMDSSLWGINALSSGQAILFALLGSCFIIPIVALLFTPILKLLKKIKFVNKFFLALENKLYKQSEDLSKKHKKIFWGLFLFVFLPLPFTGVYTGTILGVILKFPLLKTFASIMLGNFTKCITIACFCNVINPSIIIIFLCTLLIVLLGYKLLKTMFHKV